MEAEADVKGSEDEEDWMDQREPLVYNHGGAAVEDGGESEWLVVFSDFSAGDETYFEGHEEMSEDLDMSEEVTYYSGRFDGIPRNCNGSMDTLEEYLALLLKTKILRIKYS